MRPWLLLVAIAACKVKDPPPVTATWTDSFERNTPGRNYYKEIEDKLFTISGLKTLISHNFYDEEGFWKVWNKPNYEAAKKVLDRRNIQRDLYEKTCRATQGR